MACPTCNGTGMVSNPTHALPCPAPDCPHRVLPQVQVVNIKPESGWSDRPLLFGEELHNE